MQQYGKEVDCWSFGVTLFQMMFGTLPFPTKSEESFRDAVLQGASYLQNKGGCGEMDEVCMKSIIFSVKSIMLGLNLVYCTQPDVEPVLKETVINLLNPNALHRWTSEQALAYLQVNCVSKTRNCVSKTRNCVSKTRNCVSKMMNFASV